MALAQRLLPLLLLWVALHARTAQAAPWRARGADGGGGPDQSSRLAVGLEPLGRPGPVPVGQGDPGSRPGSRMEALGDAVGLPRAEYQAEGGKKPPEAPEFRKQILKKSQGGRDMDRKAVQKEAFPEGSSRSLPVPGGKLEGMRDTGRPVPPKPGEVHRSRVYEFFQTDSGTDQSHWESPKETRPETWEHLQQCPFRRKGRKGERGSSVCCEGLTPSPRVGVALPAAGTGFVRVP
nr:uncharacterized protein LOC110356442 [Columba livia]